MTPLKYGDVVQLTCAGRTVEATVVLASGNGRSLAVTFEAIVAGWVGGCAILVDDVEAGTGHTLNGAPVTMTRRVD